MEYSTTNVTDAKVKLLLTLIVDWDYVFAQGFCSYKSNATVNGKTNDNGQIGDCTAYCNDYCLHHVEVVSNDGAIGIAKELIPLVRFRIWQMKEQAVRILFWLLILV